MVNLRRNVSTELKVPIGGGESLTRPETPYTRHLLTPAALGFLYQQRRFTAF